MKINFLDIRNTAALFFILVFAAGCFFNKKNNLDSEDIINEEELMEISDSTGVDSTGLLYKSEEPFYPLQETIDDIQEEMADLRARIIDYESRVRGQDNSIDILHKIQYPHLTHEIELTNGTLVNGNIVQENSDRMIVKTQIGQLTIDKSNIVTVKSISPNVPDLKFEGDAIDEIYPNHRVFTGNIYNDGFRRADFVRVIYKLWSEKTELIGIDSTFIDGSKYIYKSGVISDTALEPGHSTKFIVHVSADSSLVRYVTREIKWDIFE